MSPRDRDTAAADLVVRELGSLPPDGPVLVIGDPAEDVAAAAREAGSPVTRWDRRASAGTPRVPGPWPEPGPYRLVTLRLPHSWDEFDMAVHAALSVLEPGGRLLVYGANDEGIRSAPPRLEALVGRVGTLAVGGRSRLLGCVRPAVVAGLRAHLRDWRVETPVTFPWGDEAWVSYPGLFAHGRLDPGTGLLLEHLPELGPGDGVLDYGAGSGAIGAAVLRAAPDADVTLLDIDTVAAEAARENVPTARVIAGDGWSALDAAARFDHVIANPPYHRGKQETLAEIEKLVQGAAGRLAPGGRLRVVVQRRHAVGDLMQGALAAVRPVADGGVFRVWEGRRR